jgi:DUF4097 and DUF4098 domain-containing protein YvlB
MNSLARCAFAFGLLVTALQAAERDVIRTFAARPGCSVAIDTYRGNVTIVESDDPEIRIAVHLEIGADREEEADRLLRDLQLDFTETGNAVSVIARHPQETGAHFDWNDKSQIAPTFRVTVPRDCSVDLSTRSGSIIVGNLNGRLRARTDTGDIFFRHTAGSVEASTREGDVVVSHCDGSVKVRVLRGTVQLGVITGPCDVSDSSGGIEVMAAKGDIHAFAAAGSAIIGLPRDYTGQSEITTSGGNIVVKIDPAAKCEVDASTSAFSRVKCRLPVAVLDGGIGRRRLVARLNDGGSRVVLKASGGDVSLQPGSSPFE